MVEAMNANQAAVLEAKPELEPSESPAKMDRLDKKISALNAQVLSL